jgi:hypothetical protein
MQSDAGSRTRQVVEAANLDAAVVQALALASPDAFVIIQVDDVADGVRCMMESLSRTSLEAQKS